MPGQIIHLSERLNRVHHRMDQLLRQMPEFEAHADALARGPRPALVELERWLYDPHMSVTQRHLAMLWLSTDPRQEALQLLDGYVAPYEPERSINLYVSHRLARFYWRQRYEALYDPDVA